MRLIPFLWFASVAAATPTPAPTATPTCPDACDQTFKLFLTTDNYPDDTTWSLTSPCNSTSGGPYSLEFTELIEEVQICGGQNYTFEIFDLFGDGLSIQNWATTTTASRTRAKIRCEV